MIYFLETLFCKWVFWLPPQFTFQQVNYILIWRSFWSQISFKAHTIRQNNTSIIRRTHTHQFVDVFDINYWQMSWRKCSQPDVCFFQRLNFVFHLLHAYYFWGIDVQSASQSTLSVAETSYDLWNGLEKDEEWITVIIPIIISDCLLCLLFCLHPFKHDHWCFFLNLHVFE